jgi:hypothetical protein
MIELIVEGKYLMDLPSNIEISVVDENPMFLEDRIPAPYSLDFEVPATLNNLKAFGFPTRIASNVFKLRTDAELRFFGIVMGRGEVLLLENEKTLKLQFKGSLEHENVSKNINQLDLGEYNYGTAPSFLTPPFLDYASQNFYNYRTSMYNQGLNPTDFVIAPVKIKGENEYLSQGYSSVYKIPYNQYINYWETTYYSEPVFHLGNTEKFVPAMMPFPFLWKIIEQGFGGQLQSNPFAAGDLAKLVMVSQNHKYFYENVLFKTLYQSFSYSMPLLDQYDASGNEQLKFAIKSFQQAYAFKSFLKNLLKIFSMTAFAGNKYSLEFNNDIFDRNTVTSMDDKLAGDMLVTYDDAKDYKFMYSDYGESEAENISVGIISQMFNLYKNLNQQFSTTYKDTAVGNIVELKGQLVGLGNHLEMTADIKKSALAIKKTTSSRGKYEVNSEVSPLDMNIHLTGNRFNNPNDYNPISENRHIYVAEIEKKNLEASPHIMFYGGMAQNFEQNGQYPYLMAHHTDHFGVQRLNTSLHPEGSGGLIEKFHGKFKQWVEKDKKRVRGSFKLTPLEIKNLNIRDKIHLKGRLFYIEKKEYTLMNKGISLVDMELIEI